MKSIFNNALVGSALVWFGALVGAACSSSETASDDSESGSSGSAHAEAGDQVPDAGPECAATTGDACGVCMQGACCDALTECEQDEDCTACVTATDSEACERTAATHERVDAYLSCRGGADCAETCVAATGGECTGLLDDLVAPACIACLESNCCEEVASCKGEEVCWDGCFTNHDEAKCHGDPDGHALFHAMGQCSSKHCATECK